MNPIYAQQAELVAERIDPAEMMLDPVTIIAIVTQVLPVIASCFSRNDSPDPAMAAERFHAAYEDNPKKLRKRLARRVRAEAEQPMTKEQSFLMANAIIQQMLASDAEVIAYAVAEAPANL